MEPLKRFSAAPVFQHNPEKTLRAMQVNIFANWRMVSMLIFVLLELFARPIDLLQNETVLILTAAVLLLWVDDKVERGDIFIRVALDVYHQGWIKNAI